MTVRNCQAPASSRGPGLNEELPQMTSVGAPNDEAMMEAWLGQVEDDAPGDWDYADQD
jgi:hypothetical protein